MVVVIAVAVGLGLMLLAVWAGHNSLRNAGPSSGMGNALGGGLDVFDPGQGRMKEELDSKEHTREQLPSPEDDERPVRVDLRAGTIHIRKPPPNP